MFVCFLFLDVCNYISEITEHYSALTVYRLSLKSYSPNASNEIVHTKHIKEILGGANCLIFLWCSISAFSGSALFWCCAWKLLDPLLFFLFFGGGGLQLLMFVLSPGWLWISALVVPPAPVISLFFHAPSSWYRHLLGLLYLSQLLLLVNHHCV